ncbi:phosphotransferase [Spiroplasma cantharicola]|uniref:Putative choline kinase n=1 Tax=Spiroplasma cantharicola TaxID=362837 RepID=A0A0M4JJD3_9MOLU|nr:phosphotransferase [Spiroplasma cantharicola]ALD66273.1 putative choline kinase [Spiroplasma cantharicola]
MKFNGYTNKVKLEKDILKKQSVDFHNIYLDKENEYNFLKQLKDINQDILLAPLKFYWKDNQLFSEYKFLRDFQTLKDIKITKEIIDNVVNLIKKLHNFNSKEFKIKKFDYHKLLATFKNNTNTLLFNFELHFNEISKEIDKFDGLDLVLSHNDLVPGNILVNKNKIILIDYDYISLNNKFFDIASFISETLNDDEKMIKYFIKQCIEKELIYVDEIGILNSMIKYQDLLWTLWANFMLEKKKQIIFKEIFESKLERLKSRKIY